MRVLRKEWVFVRPKKNGREKQWVSNEGGEGGEARKQPRSHHRDF